MPAAPLPADEGNRLAALARYSILDTPAEEAFDRLTRLAKHLFDVPIALVSLTDEKRQWFKSAHGLDFSECRRDGAFCAHAILGDDPLVVPDAARDERFAANPLVTGRPGIRFYAGVPLRTQDRHKLGTLCVMDTKPRPPLTPMQEQSLRDLAALAAEELDRRLATERDLRASFIASYDGLFDCDLIGGRTYYSAGWKKLLGYGPDELADTPETWDQLVHPEDWPWVRQRLQDHFHRRTEQYTAEYRMRHKDGSWRWIHARGQAQWDLAGRAVRIVGSHTDITERKSAEKRLASEAMTDALTGLANRRQLLRRLNEMVHAAERYGHSLTVALADADRFKSINDTYGHEAGDAAIVGLGRTLRGTLRLCDVAGRLGGDEFLVLLPHTNAENAWKVIDRVRQKLASIPFETAKGRTFHVTATFGVAGYVPGMDARALLNAADEALYAAKQQGRNRVLIGEPKAPRVPG